MVVKKIVYIDKHADKEIRLFSHKVQLKIYSFIQLLKENGRLEEPYAKKLNAYNNLYEIRINLMGSWRVFYAYIQKEYIIILGAFQKKKQKTPQDEINKAQKRLRAYEEGL
jgi:phage-related protein